MLTPEQKAAGRAFRDACQRVLTEQVRTAPPTYTVPIFIANYRHDCPARGNRSTALELKERYQRSPQVTVNGVVIPAAFFAFLHRTGRCRHCQASAVASVGRLVVAADRPPLSTKERP